MNRLTRSCSVPAELTFLVEQPCLLPGENRHEFEALRLIMIDEIQPQSKIEWLWLLDLVECSWEILRYRRLKQRILDVFREAAIASILHRIDSAGMPPEMSELVQRYSGHAAAEWKDNPDAAVGIEARLARNGYDEIAVNAEVFIRARNEIAMFDSLMHSAQHRRMVLLREIGIRRELASRARKEFGTELSIGPNRTGRP
jgi:hypothetical protein